MEQQLGSTLYKYVVREQWDGQIVNFYRGGLGIIALNNDQSQEKLKLLYNQKHPAIRRIKLKVDND
jgi:hypothetical protein